MARERVDITDLTNDIVDDVIQQVCAAPNGMFTISRKHDISLPVRVLTTRIQYRAGKYDPKQKAVISNHEAFTEKLRSVADFHGKTVNLARAEKTSDYPEIGLAIGCDFTYRISVPFVSPPRRIPDELSSLLPTEIVQYVNEEWSRSTITVSPRASEGLHRLAELSYPAKKRTDLSCGICDANNRTTSICRRCVKDVNEGLPVWDENSWHHTMNWGLDALGHELEGLAQPPGPFSMKKVSPQEVRRAVVRMMALQGDATWLERVAGKLGGVQTVRGLVSIADDGHLCRSAFERTIDDFMHRNGIYHEVEPLYPFDPELNELGRLKADWKLADGTLVEAYGMMDSNEYAQQVRRKQELSRKHSQKVLEILPGDVTRLPVIFSEWIH